MIKDPTYYVQEGIRNSKKTTTRHICKLGKNSELLKVTDDPLTYCQEMVKKMNEEARITKQERTMKVNFNQKVPPLDVHISQSRCLFTGYFYIQFNYQKLHLASFFEKLQRDDSTNYYNIHRFLIYQCIFHNCDTPYFEEFKIDQDLILAFKDVLVHHKDQYLDHLLKHTHVPIQYDQRI